MCHVRGFKHSQCGHTTYRRISACRGTYASPRAPDTPRCSPSASIVISLSKTCRECEYQAFCDDWQSRIDEVRSRRDSFQTLLGDMDLESSEDYWGCELDFDQDWAESHSTTIADFAPNRLRRRSTAPAKLRDQPANFCDSASLREERNRLSEELDRLNTQYNQDAWNNFKPFVGGMNEDQWALAARMRRRKCTPRFAGASPLREVTSSDEVSPDTHQLPDIIEEEPDLSSGSSDSGESSDSLTPASTPPKSHESTLWSQLADDSLHCPLSAQAMASAESGGMVMEWRKSFAMPQVVEPVAPAPAIPTRSSGLTGKLKRIHIAPLSVPSQNLQVPRAIGRRMSLSPVSGSPTGGMLPNW